MSERSVSRKRRDLPPVAAILLLAPGALAVILLAVVPLLFIARNSFAESDNYGAVVGGFTLANYQTLLDPAYAKTIVYSLVLATVNAAVCLVVGYIVSNFIVSKTPRTQAFLLLLLIIPFWTDFLVRTFALMTLLGRGGPLVWLMTAIGWQADPLVPSQPAVIFALVYAFLPTAVFPIYAAMRGIDPSLREAASDLGCGWWRTHAKVIIPLTMPGIVATILLTFIPTLGVFVIPVLLGGGKNPLVGNLIVTLYTEFRNQPLGAALAMVVLVLMTLSLAIAAFGMQMRKRRA